MMRKTTLHLNHQKAVAVKAKQSDIRYSFLPVHNASITVHGGMKPER